MVSAAKQSACPPMGTMAHVCLPLCSLQQQANVSDFIRCESRCWSSWEWVARVGRLSHALTQRLALGEGSVAMIASLSTDWLLEALLAACDAGLVACTVNHRWSSNELSAAMTLSQPVAIFTDAHCNQLVQQALQLHLKDGGSSKPPVVIQLGSACPKLELPKVLSVMACEDLISWTTAQQPAHATYQSRQQLSSVQLQLKQPASGAAMICFTSGTTGKPKGVLLSHTAFNTQSLAKLAVVGYSNKDTYMHLAPLFHIGGLSSAFACIMAGARHVLLPKYTAAEALRCIQQYNVTSMIAVPAIMQDLLALTKHPVGSFHGHKVDVSLTLPSVRCILMGGGVTTPDLLARMASLFPHASVMSAYGMTEACSSMTFRTLIPHQTTIKQQPALQSDNSIADQELWVGAACAGWPAPGIGIKIMPISDQQASARSSTQNSSALGSMQGSSVGEGNKPARELVVGEVWTRGPHTLLEYWGSPVDTQQVCAPGGWLRTGDLGFVDHQGALWLKGRARDMIKSGGENVYAAEVESALSSHACVSAAVVVGLPHLTWGEQVCALVVLTPGTAWQGITVDPTVWQTAANSQLQQTAASLQSQQTTAGMQLQQTAATAQSDQAGAGRMVQVGSEHTSGSLVDMQGAGSAGLNSSTQVLNAEVLQTHCRHIVRLSPYKLPRLIAAMQTHTGAAASASLLPVNASGKVLKDKVKAALMHAFAARHQGAQTPQVKEAASRSRL